MTTREDTLDLGQRYFVCSVFAALTVGSLLTVLIIGAAFNWIGAILGVAANLALVVVAERLYSKGMIGLARIGVFAQTILCLLFVALALTTHNKTGNWMLAGVLASGAVFYGVQFISSHILVFLADRRGERIELDTSGEVAAATTAFAVSADKKLVLREELKAGYKLLSTVAFASGGLVLLLSVAATVGGVMGLIVVDLGDWFGLLVIGVLAHVVGMVLITTSHDANFLATTQGYEGNHLTNTLKSLNMFLSLQVGLAGLMVVVLLIRWMATS